MKRRLSIRKTSGTPRRVGIHIAQTSLTVSVVSAETSTLELCETHECTRASAGEVLSRFVDSHNLKGLPAYAALSRDDYDTQFVDLPGIGENELRQALPWRVKPPGVLGNDEVVTTGVRLSNDREVSGDETTLVRATIMSKSLLHQLSDAINSAGLDLRAVFPRETALVTLAKQGVEGTGLDVDGEASAPPIMTVFVAQRSTGVTVARGDQLYLSRTVTMEVNPDTGFDQAQTDQLVSECVRTATNFNKRLSSTPLTEALIGPDAPGMAGVRDALSQALGINCQALSLPPHIKPADDVVRAAAETPDGMLAISATLNVALPENASIYQPPAQDRSLTSPPALAAATVIGLLVLAAISGVQAWQINKRAEAIDTAQAQRDKRNDTVASLRSRLEAAKNVEPSDQLVARRDRLQRQYNAYESIIGAFQGIDTSLLNGFAAPMDALSNAVVEGLWLQRINIETDAVSLGGNTLSAFEAETFASRLSATAPFAGWTPRTLDIGNRTERPSGLVVHDFTITGKGPLANAPSSADTAATENSEFSSLLRGLNDPND